jgi:antitoxin (DNA-binding transcriptional repressor) of toxin-antitoxin stability system
MEQMRAVKAKRAVSVRELQRSAAHLVNEVELEDAAFVLCRYGRMVALLCPIPDRTVLEFSGPERPPPDLEPTTDHAETREEWAELSDEQRIVLHHAAGVHPSNLHLSTVPLPPSPIAVAVGSLEIAGLMERTLRGWTATAAGLAAARWLDSEEAAPPS